MAGCGENQAEDSSCGKTQDINFQVLNAPGYYGDIRMQPNGVFLVRDKLTDEQAQNYGVVYKVDYNEENKLSKITVMQGGIPIAVDWQDTLNRKFKFSAVTVEYTNTQIRYNFKSSRMAAVPGFYDAYAIGYKIDETKKNTPVAHRYDKEGNQLGAWHGYSQMFFSYDDKGDLTKIAFIGKDEQAEGIKAWGNIATLEFEYTPEGWVSSVAAFATDDAPIALAKNYFGDNVVKLELENDEYGNQSKMIFYGKDDNAVTASKLGAAEIRFKHDEKRRETGMEFYGTGGDKIEVNDIGFSYHGATFEYDDDGIILRIYYDKDSNEVHRREVQKNNPAVTQASAEAVATSNPPATTSNAAVDTLNSFHRNITNKNYRGAYNLLSASFQNATDYYGWADGFKTTISSSVSDIGVDNPGGTKKFRGTATLVRENGVRKIDTLNNKAL